VNIENHLSHIRQKRGYSAAALAGKVGVSRQTIYAMEAGSYVPNTLVALRLARVFEVQVEELFRLEDASPPPPTAREVDLLPGGQAVEPGLPVQICPVDKRTMGVSPTPVAWYLPPADGVVIDSPEKVSRQRKTRVQPFQDEEQFGNRLLLAGCDPAMSVLARHLQKANIELILAHRNSSQALDLLRTGCVHIGGSHLRDEATGESNLPQVRKLFRRTAVVIAFALWEEGIVVAKGNPKGIREIADFARKGVCLVNREPGSGSRSLVDSSLKRLGIASSKVKGYSQVAYGHLPAAWQVRTGHADCCVATRAAARVFGLDFVPLLSERYDLVIRKPHLALPAVQLLLDALNRNALRRELEGLGGYDTSDTGKQVA
jgi:molybdate-binding protein/DNA-binding XRE family transcriptional regulator